VKQALIGNLLRMYEPEEENSSLKKFLPWYRLKLGLKELSPLPYWVQQPLI
jgi:hypothetical protein